LIKKYAFKLKKPYQEKGFAEIATKKKISQLLLKKSQILEIKQVIAEKKPSDVGINSDFWATLILAEYIKKKYKAAYKSRTSYHIILKKSGFTYHKPEKHYHSQNKKILAK
jgi:transposase